MVKFQDLINDFSHYRELLNEQKNTLRFQCLVITYHVFLRNWGETGGKFPEGREARWGKLSIVISSGTPKWSV